MADDRLINVIRPTLIKAQREVAAYEKKRDSMRGKVNLAEVNRSSTGSILMAETIGQKLYNAASFVSAGAKEAAFKTELAMLERQILGFKEDFGVELYPVFQSMEDNEGWLPTDRKVRSLYDNAREDIAKMEQAKAEKREQIKQMDGVEGSGLTPPVVPVTSAPFVVATPVEPSNNAQMPWASAAPVATKESAAPSAFGTSYGSSQPANNCAFGSDSFSSIGQSQPIQHQQQQQYSNNQSSSFGFMSETTQPAAAMPQGGMNGYPNTFQQQSAPAANTASVFDPFDGLSSTPAFSTTSTSSFGASYNNTAPAQPANSNTFDPFSGSTQNGSGSQLNSADMNLFKY